MSPAHVHEAPALDASLSENGRINSGMVAPFPSNSLLGDPSPGVTVEPVSPGVSYDDPNPLECSRITYDGPNINSTVTFSVPEGWSVWRCIEERFGFVADQYMMEHIGHLQQKIDADPTLKVRDVNVVPVGYTFIMGIGGGGPDPIE